MSARPGVRGLGQAWRVWPLSWKESGAREAQYGRGAIGYEIQKGPSFVQQTLAEPLCAVGLPEGMGWWGPGLGRLSSSSSQAVTEMLSAQGSTCHAGTICGFSRGLAKLQIPSSQGGSNPGSVRHPGAVGSMLGSQGHAGPACSTPASPPSAHLLGSPQMRILLATSPLTRC